GECEELRAIDVVERLLAEAIAAAEEALARAIPEDERPHAVQPLHAIVTPEAIGLQDHLGIRVVGHEARAERDQFPPQLCEVVDLAVEDDSDLAIGGPHR